VTVPPAVHRCERQCGQRDALPWIRGRRHGRHEQVTEGDVGVAGLCRDVADEQLREAHAGEDARWQLADGRPVVGREVEQRRRRQEGTC